MSRPHGEDAMTNTVSIVAAAYNEEDNLPELIRRVLGVAPALAREGISLELVLVDDHSTDRTAEIGRQAAREHPGVKYVRLSRNSGAHMADRVGLRVCAGDCAVVMAADLQDPPEMVPDLVARWRQGYHVVWAVRAEREGERGTTKLFARIYYWLMRRLALPEIPEQGADFLLIDRKVVDACNDTSEKNTSYLALILWMGFRQTTLEYVKQARHAGRSKWTLRVVSLAGIIVSAIGFLYAIDVVISAISGLPVQGWASLMVVVLILGGLQLLTLGVLGEYLWRTFDEARGRPRYIIEEYVTSKGLSSTPHAEDNPS